MHPDQQVNATQFDAQHQPPRCRHTLLSGLTCGQPALRGRDLCRFHQAVAPIRREFILPIVEDAASLQLALNRVMRALADDLLTYKKAALLLYALQIAASNFKRLREEMQEVANSADQANEKSLIKELLQVLQLPETEAERLAEESAAEMERQGQPSGTFTIKACACDGRSGPNRSPATANRQPTAENRYLRRSLRSKSLRVHSMHVEEPSQETQAPSQEKNQNRVSRAAVSDRCLPAAACREAG